MNGVRKIKLPGRSNRPVPERSQHIILSRVATKGKELLGCSLSPRHQLKFKKRRFCTH